MPNGVSGAATPLAGLQGKKKQLKVKKSKSFGKGKRADKRPVRNALLSGAKF